MVLLHRVETAPAIAGFLQVLFAHDVAAGTLDKLFCLVAAINLLHVILTSSGDVLHVYPLQ